MGLISGLFANSRHQLSEIRQSLDIEVRNGIAGQGFKNDVGLATPLHLATEGDVLGIGKQNDYQEDGRIVGQPAR